MSLISFPIRPAPAETNFDWAGRFYRTLAETETLLRKADNSLWIAVPGTQPTRISSVDDFRGRIHNLVHFVRTEADGTEIPCPLSYETAQILFYSLQIGNLPLLKSLIYEPAVVPAGTGYVITKPGFDPLTGIFYFVPPPHSPIVPLKGTTHLETLFSGVPVAKPEYRYNLLAWLLGAVVLDPDIDPPLLVVTGNMRGIGKSKTVEACGVILTGQIQTPINQHAEEFEKQLGSRFRDGTRFIAFDNVVTPNGKSYKNERLSGLLTSGFSKQVRVLGHSRSVEQQGVVFAMSANDAKLDPDLSSRALPVQLYADVSKSMTPFVLDYAKTYRREIYGELLNLALTPAEHITNSLHPQFRFRRWLDFVYPRIATSFGPLAVEEAQELDDVVIELFSWGSDLGDRRFSAKDLIEAVTSSRDAYPAVAERLLAKPSERSRLIRAGKLLSGLANKSVTLDKGVALTLKEAPPTSLSHSAGVYFFSSVAD